MLYQSSPIRTITNHFSSTVSIQDNTPQLSEDSVVTCTDNNLDVIWYHDNEDFNENIQFEMKNRLSGPFTSVYIYNKPCKFAAFLLFPPVTTKIFFIITSEESKSWCTLAKKHPQCEQVYQFQSTISLDDGFLLFSDVNNLFTQMLKDKEIYLNKHQSSFTTRPSPVNCRESAHLPPWSIWNYKKTENSFQYWRKESPKFFLFQALTRILTQIKCDHDGSFAEMIKECRLYYINNPAEVRKIDKFENSYDAKNAIWHYTTDSFLFRLVGRAFRSEDFECIFKFRRYIIDLHVELDELGKKHESLQKILRLYRGKQIRRTDLQQLQNNIGSLISMNGFLSTTRNRDTALEVFAGVGENRPDSDYKSVLYEFCIDEIIISRIYADISNVSQFSEEEVLFTIGSVWRIGSVDKTDNLFWTIKLITCSDTDSRLSEFFKEISDDSTFLMLGDILRELGQHTKAEKFYDKMLRESKVNNETRGTLYYNIAMINIDQGKDSVALENLQKAVTLLAEKVQTSTEPLSPQPLCSHSIIPSLIHILNNMGLTYQKIDDSEKSLECFTRAPEVERSDPIDKATVHDNIGSLLYSKGEYDNALKHLSDAVNLAQDHSSLPKFKQHYDAVNKHVLSRSTSLNDELDQSVPIIDVPSRNASSDLSPVPSTTLIFCVLRFFLVCLLFSFFAVLYKVASDFNRTQLE